MRFANYFLFKIGIGEKSNILLFILFVCLLFACDSIKDIEIKNIEELKKLNEKSVSVIEIFKEGKLVKRIDNTQEINDFTNSLADLTKFHPNHPNYSNEWYVKIKLTDGIYEELYLMQEKNDQKNLYINPLGHRWLGGGGTARSKLLYKWCMVQKLIRSQQYENPNPAKPSGETKGPRGPLTN